MLVCVALIYLLRGLCVRIGLVDHPSDRKTHGQSTPLGGGVAMSAAVVSVLFWENLLTGKVAVLLAASVVLVLLGIFDDKYGLPVRLRVLIQVLVSLVVILGADGTVLHSGNIFGFDLVLGLMAVPFSVLAFVGGINAINMIDGADGMAGKMAGITMAGVIAILSHAGETSLIPLAVGVLGALVGFLIFNARIFVRRAWVFMGDAGSMWLGLVLGWFMAQITQGEVLAQPPVVLWLFGLPLIDTLAVMLRRLSHKTSPFMADRSHIHHALEQAGFSVRQTVLILSVVQILLVTVAVTCYLRETPAAIVFWSFMMLFVAYYSVLRYGRKYIWRNQEIEHKRGGEPPVRSNYS